MTKRTTRELARSRLIWPRSPTCPFPTWLSVPPPSIQACRRIWRYATPPKSSRAGHSRTPATGVVFENGSETNNTAEAADVFDIVRIPYADLTIAQLTAPSSGGTGLPLHVEWTVRNNASQAIGPTNVNSWLDTVKLARNS